MSTTRLKFISIVLSFSAVIPLSSCSATKVVERDYCKQVMQIVGSYTDSQIKAMSDLDGLGDLEGVMAKASKTIKELRIMAAEMPSGKQKDYVNDLATDYELSLDPDAGIEFMMALMADLTPTKIQIICPK